MKQNKALNIITAILATILSIPLVLFTFSATLTSTVASIAKPGTLINFVQNIDFESAFESTEEIDDFFGTEQLDTTTLNNITKSSLFKELLTLYVDDFSNALKGKNSKSAVTAEAIKEIANDNIDEITELVAASSSEDIDKEAMQQEILTIFDENAQAIADSLPSAKQLLSEVDKEILNAINLAVGPLPTLILAGVALIFAALIYACRCRKFGALLWIGIDVCIAAVLSTLSAVSIKFAAPILATEDGFATVAIISVAKVVSNNLLLRVGVLVFIAVLFIVGYILLKKYVVNKKDKLPSEVNESDKTLAIETE